MKSEKLALHHSCSGILLKCPLLSAKLATGPRYHHGVQDVTAVNVLVIFTPHRRKPKGSYRWRKFRPRRTCSTEAGTCREPRRTSSWRSDDCGLVRCWIAFHRWTEFAPSSEMRRDGEVDIFPDVHACYQPSEVKPFGDCTAWVEALVWLFGGKIRTEILVSRPIFRIDTAEFHWMRFLMSWRFLMVLIVIFLPLLGRSPVCPSSCNRLMALHTFGGATPSFHAMPQLRVPCSCNTKTLSRWLGISKRNVQCDKQFCKQIINVVLLAAQYSCDESVRHAIRHIRARINQLCYHFLGGHPMLVTLISIAR